MIRTADCVTDVRLQHMSATPIAMSPPATDPALGRASRLQTEPWYLPIADEIELFDAASQARLPVLLKGPTGCGKPRFIDHIAWRYHRRAGGPFALGGGAC